jgi:hypothetical protein
MTLQWMMYPFSHCPSAALGFVWQTPSEYKLELKTGIPEGQGSEVARDVAEVEVLVEDLELVAAIDSISAEI